MVHHYVKVSKSSGNHGYRKCALRDTLNTHYNDGAYYLSDGFPNIIELLQSIVTPDLLPNLLSSKSPYKPCISDTSNH